ncbi:zinc finger MYM-type protein 1-like [Leptinotarsa decemlineata]|uniref:zinc finger MYM-type protein 1-like n=1 Tax=Leptinotarsa decemlineata TaxID=7539 RepID=UPI003D30C0AF
MLLEVLAEFDPFLREHIRKYGNPGKGHISYLSSTICDEFIELLGKKVTDYILEEAKSSQYFSLIVDSTPDISHVDQLSFVIRYMKQQNGEPVERFLKFLPHIGHKALDMFNSVIDTLQRYGLDIQKCRGQSYDNASNMCGIYSGLQAEILDVSPLASYIPCAGHSLNLVGTHAVDSCIEAVSLFTLFQELYNVFSSSTHRWAVLNNCKNTTLTTKSLSTTRWSARHDASRALQEEWPAIIRALEILEDQIRRLTLEQTLKAY